MNPFAKDAEVNSSKGNGGYMCALCARFVPTTTRLAPLPLHCLARFSTVSSPIYNTHHSLTSTLSLSLTAMFSKVALAALVALVASPVFADRTSFFASIACLQSSEANP